MTKKYYSGGHKLLSVLAELEEDLKHNYENGTTYQKALANIGGLQGDLFSAYLLLLGPDESGPLISRSILLRAILENQGAIHHIKNNKERSRKYLNHVDKMQQQVKDHVEGQATDEKDLTWSTSTIKHRVGLINDSAPRLYDTLSNFTHGNNVQYFFDTEELTRAYINAIDSYWVGMFIDFMAELAVGLDMDDSKRKTIFDGIGVVGKSK